jgi:hypothetical protein
VKHILVIHYSQSGQLTEIVNNVVSTIDRKTVQIDFHNLQMETPYPFPWDKSSFFGVFPETFMQIPEKVKPVSPEILNKKYDLIILGYQIWYLTPSLPTTSFLETADAKQLFSNTPVVTVIGCRNMWIMAQEKMKVRLNKLGSTLVGNMVLADRHLNHISVITIANWMFSGKKERYLGIFPKPGVAQKDIDASVKFGTVISNHMKDDNLSNLQDQLLQIGAVKIKPFLITVDKRANLIFSKWAKLILTKGEKDSPKRKVWVKLFNNYLLFAIWIISPIVFILFLLTFLPLYGNIKKDKIYYSSTALKQRKVLK